MEQVRRRVTLSELAAAAGTSQAAASYAMNEQPGVSDSTRQHILATAERIGYHRRPFRRATVPSVRTIDVALSPTRHRGEIPNYYVSELLAGADQEAQLSGVRLDARLWSPDWTERGHGAADGQLFLGGAFPPEAIAGAGLPVVLVGTSFPEVAVDSVLADNHQGTYLATKHLVDQGCRRLLLLNGPTHAATTVSKTAGFAAALHQCGLAIEDMTVAHVDFDPLPSAAAAAELLRGADRPDGIVAGDDIIAIGAMHAALDLGLRVPDDLRIIGFGDSPTAELLRPALSSVHVFLRQMGQIGLRRLLDRLAAPDSDLPHVRSLVSPRLAVRGSTGSAS